MSLRTVSTATFCLVWALGGSAAHAQVRVWIADQGNNRGVNNRIMEIDPVNKKTPPDPDGTDCIILRTLPSPAGCFLDELDFDNSFRMWAVVKDTCNQSIDGARRIDKETGAIDNPPGLLSITFASESMDGILEGLAWDGTGLWISAVRDGPPGNMLTRVSPVTGQQIAPFTAPPLAGGKCNIPGTVAQGLLWESGNNGYGWLWHSDVAAKKLYKLDVSRLWTNPSYNPNDPNGLKVAEYTVPCEPKGLAWMGSKIWIATPRSSTGGIYEFDPATGTTVKKFSTPNWHLDGIAIYQPPPGPEIKLSTDTLTASAWIGEGNPPNSTFTVANNGSDTLSYTITDDADWLTVTPDSGSSTGAANTHTVSFNVSSKTADTYHATITVAGNAWNTDKQISVTLTIQTVRPDIDGDGDVDQIDFGVFQACYTLPGNVAQGPCAAADLNGDTFVTGTDVPIFLNCLSGSGTPADKTCQPQP